MEFISAIVITLLSSWSILYLQVQQVNSLYAYNHPFCLRRLGCLLLSDFLPRWELVCSFLISDVAVRYRAEMFLARISFSSFKILFSRFNFSISVNAFSNSFVSSSTWIFQEFFISAFLKDQAKHKEANSGYLVLKTYKDNITVYPGRKL